MSTIKRPFQDETIFNPYMRKLYTGSVLGRSGDTREEPIKYTQALSEGLHFEAQAEWLARVNEYMCGSEKVMEKMDEDTMMASEVRVEDMGTGFGMYPPLFVMPIGVSPAALSMIYGESADMCWVCMDEFTLENLWAIDWHFERGTQTDTLLWYIDEDWKLLTDRRHMRTGEKFRYLCVQRGFEEGVAMVTDILKDIRNEVLPDFADSPLHYHGYVNNITLDAQYSSRSEFELIHLMNFYISTQIGFPDQSYTCFSPFPELHAMTLQMPVDIIPQRLLGMITGKDLWMSNYTISHLETSLECFGEEMIPPTSTESLGSSIKHGMDRIVYPSSFRQSKYVYGQEAMCREPTKYPCPQKVVVSTADANKQIETVREEHTEWLVDG